MGTKCIYTGNFQFSQRHPSGFDFNVGLLISIRTDGAPIHSHISAALGHALRRLEKRYGVDAFFVDSKEGLIDSVSVAVKNQLNSSRTVIVLAKKRTSPNQFNQNKKQRTKSMSYVNSPLSLKLETSISSSPPPS